MLLESLVCHSAQSTLVQIRNKEKKAPPPSRHVQAQRVECNFAPQILEGTSCFAHSPLGSGQRLPSLIVNQGRACTQTIFFPQQISSASDQSNSSISRCPGNRKAVRIASHRIAAMAPTKRPRPLAEQDEDDIVDVRQARSHLRPEEAVRFYPKHLVHPSDQDYRTEEARTSFHRRPKKNGTDAPARRCIELRKRRGRGPRTSRLPTTDSV